MLPFIQMIKALFSYHNESSDHSLILGLERGLLFVPFLCIWIGMREMFTHKMNEHYIALLLTMGTIFAHK